MENTQIGTFKNFYVNLYLTLFYNLVWNRIKVLEFGVKYLYEIESISA